MIDPATAALIALKTSALVVAAGFAAWLMARQSAARRHLVWVGVLALSLLMPFAVAYLPSGVTVSLPVQAAMNLTGAGAASSKGDAPRAGVAAVDSGRHVAASVAHDERPAAWPILPVIWLVGALVVLLRKALAHAGLFRWVRRSRRELSPAWRETLRGVVVAAESRGRLRVFESAEATSPCTFGVLRPVVLLPAASAGWPEAQRRFTLLHELAHVRRADYLTTQLAAVACAVHWFNPLVWYAARQAGKLQEEACDDVVLNAGTRPSDYAEFLVLLAAGSRRTLPAFAAAVGMVRRHELHGRIAAILDASRLRLPLGRFASLIVFAPLAVLTLFLATLSVSAAPPATQSGMPGLAPFQSVELRNGGKLRLVHGEAQAVNLMTGDPAQASIRVLGDGRLVVDRCPTECPRNHDFEVVVVTPALSAVYVAEGGAIEARGGFPPQPAITIAVSQGGAVDIRAMPIANVTATVFSGGRIFTSPGTTLAADVEQGGNVTYWGEAAVESSIRHGGVVERGAAADRDRPLAALMGPQFLEPPAPVPAAPPVPALP